MSPAESDLAALTAYAATKRRDTIPSPRPCVDPELLEAYGDDLYVIIDQLQGLADQIGVLVASMRRQAVAARTKGRGT